MVARSTVLSRAATVWPPGGVPYSQVARHQPDGYRQDCSGYVSMCWQLPTPGETTVTLVTRGLMRPILVSQLLPADAVGRCGPGTEGDAGHIQLVEAVTKTGLVIWEQAGGQPGPTRRTITRLPAGYLAYRLNGIEDHQEEDMTPEEHQRLIATDNRVRDALVLGRQTMNDQPGEGANQPVYIVRAIEELRAGQARIERALLALAGLGDHTHPITGTTSGAVPTE